MVKENHNEIGEDTKVNLTVKVFISVIVATVVMTTSFLVGYLNLKNQQDAIMAQHRVMIKKMARIECKIAPNALDCDKDGNPTENATYLPMSLNFDEGFSKSSTPFASLSKL